MTLHTPLAVQPATGDAAQVTTAQEFRMYTRSLLTKAAGVQAEQGINSSSAFQVTQRAAGADFSVDVSGGVAWVVGDDITNQGTYWCWSDGSVNTGASTITKPGSGTFHHRITLQIEDKLSNGTWTGYQAVIVPILDTGSGLPSEPASAITLATIDVPSTASSVTNSMINDYRQQVGPIIANKSGDTAQASTTTLTADPDLQLLNLQANATYAVVGNILYDGASPVGTADIKFSWNVNGGSGNYSVQRENVSGMQVGAFASAWTDTVTAGTTGVGAYMNLTIMGTFTTSAAPNSLVFKWAQNTSSTTNTRVRGGSALQAVRIA